MRLTFETRPAYALVAAEGVIDIAEAASLREAAAEQARTHETMRLMLDLRDAQVSRDARDAVLAWARAPHASASAMVMLDELFVAEVNMAALASGARVRAFAGTGDAHRWLTRGSMVKTPYDGGSGRPLPIDAATRRAALFGAPRATPPRRSERPAAFSPPASSPSPFAPSERHAPSEPPPTSERPTPKSISRFPKR